MISFLPGLYIGIIKKVQVCIFLATQQAANKWLGFRSPCKRAFLMGDTYEKWLFIFY